MFKFKLGMVIGLAMMIVGFAEAAPGFNYPKCVSDQTTCSANGCWMDESTRNYTVGVGGTIEVVLFAQTTNLYTCVQNAQQQSYSCTLDNTDCPGARYLSAFVTLGTECQENNNPVPPNQSSLTFIHNNGVSRPTCIP